MSRIKRMLWAGGVSAVMALLVVTGCATRGDGTRSEGRMADDQRITKDVKEALDTAPVYKFTDVNVNTFNGVVQLSGFVSSDDQKTRAGQLAREVSGVQQVINSLALKQTGGITPTGREQDTVYGTNQPPNSPDAKAPNP